MSKWMNVLRYVTKDGEEIEEFHEYGEPVYVPVEQYTFTLERVE